MKPSNQQFLSEPGQLNLAVKFQHPGNDQEIHVMNSLNSVKARCKKTKIKLFEFLNSRVPTPRTLCLGNPK